jgi:hypothetical protein
MFGGIIENNELNVIALGYNSTAYFVPSSTTITNNGEYGLGCKPNQMAGYGRKRMSSFRYYPQKSELFLYHVSSNRN